MSLTRLALTPPRVWLDDQMTFSWARRTRTWEQDSAHIDEVAERYLRSLVSTFASHALRLLNLRGGTDDETLAELTWDIRRHALSAAKRAGIYFYAGDSNSNQIIDGELSLAWLDQAAASAARFALSVWDPIKAKALHDRAVARGKISNLGLTIADLLPLEGYSISRQAKALNCSTGKISSLRKELREHRASGEPDPTATERPLLAKRTTQRSFKPYVPGAPVIMPVFRDSEDAA